MPLPTKRADRTSTRVSDPSKRRAPKSEKELADRVGGRVTVGSGNQREKGDVRITGTARIEAKCTRAKSFSVTREMWQKIEDASGSDGVDEVPVIFVEFLAPDGTPEHALYVVGQSDMEELIRRHADAKPVPSDAEPRSGTTGNTRRRRP